MGWNDMVRLLLLQMQGGIAEPLHELQSNMLMAEETCSATTTTSTVTSETHETSIKWVVSLAPLT